MNGTERNRTDQKKKVTIRSWHFRGSWMKLKKKFRFHEIFVFAKIKIQWRRKFFIDWIFFSRLLAWNINKYDGLRIGRWFRLKMVSNRLRLKFRFFVVSLNRSKRQFSLAIKQCHLNNQFVCGKLLVCTRTMGCHIFSEIILNKLSTQLLKYFVATNRICKWKCKEKPPHRPLHYTFGIHKFAFSSWCYSLTRPARGHINTHTLAHTNHTDSCLIGEMLDSFRCFALLCFITNTF